jgi:hypothetical protein
MELFSDAVRQFTSAEAGGFDLGEEQVASLLNEGAKRLASRSKWIKGLVEIGPSVAGQPIYELPPKVVQVEQLYVGEAPWTELDMLTLREVALGRRMLRSRWGDGIYAEEASEDGLTKILRLFPTPEADGVLLQAWGAITPGELSGEMLLPFPAEFNRAIVDFAKAIGYEDIDENPQSGTYFLERANGRADELGERAKAKMRTNPRQARLASLRV